MICGEGQTMGSRASDIHTTELEGLFSIEGTWTMTSGQGGGVSLHTGGGVFHFQGALGDGRSADRNKDELEFDL
jgi:hypothetical protein